MPRNLRKLSNCVFAIMMSLPALGQAGRPTIAPSSGKDLCSALTPADFTKAGVAVTRLQQANLDGPTSAYCVYQSKAGKVEFDIFFPAGGNTREVDATERTVIGEAGSAKTESAKLSGADHARFVQVSSNGNLSIVVRKGTAVFDIDVPNSANARKQLIALAEIVLSRLQH